MSRMSRYENTDQISEVFTSSTLARTRDTRTRYIGQFADADSRQNGLRLAMLRKHQRRNGRRSAAASCLVILHIRSHGPCDSNNCTALRELLGIRISDALLSGGGNCALIVEGPTELHAYPHFFTMLKYNARALGVSIISAEGSDFQKIRRHLMVLKVYDIPAVVVLDKDAQKAYDDLKGYGPNGELPNLRKVHLLSEGTFETYIPLEIALAVINENYPGEEIIPGDIDLAKKRIGEFQRLIYEKKGAASRFEHFKVQFGQLVGERMVSIGCALHPEIKEVIETVKSIAEAV
ncbi:MAG: hypothetical protein O3C40_30115 [Planctomycetota bacterium]|nr:hypothetical protein [Planctomycetota bacterium]